MIDEGEHQRSINALTLKRKMLTGGNRKKHSQKKETERNRTRKTGRKTTNVTMESPVS